MNINEKLNKAFKTIPLTQTDKRLTADSKMTPIKSRLKISKVGIHEDQEQLPPLNQPKSQNQQKPTPPPPAAPAVQPEQDLNMGNDEEEIAPIDDEGDVGLDTEEGGATPSNSNYSVETAKQQLDGIISNWMDMAGEYPEGDKRHQFLEIGERLREISGVIDRDYVKKTNNDQDKDESGELGEIGGSGQINNQNDNQSEEQVNDGDATDQELEQAISQATGR